MGDIISRIAALAENQSETPDEFFHLSVGVSDLPFLRQITVNRLAIMASEFERNLTVDIEEDDRILFDTTEERLEKGLPLIKELFTGRVVAYWMGMKERGETVFPFIGESTLKDKIFDILKGPASLKPRPITPF